MIPKSYQYAAPLLALLSTACTRAPELADPQLVSDIQQVRAIDNHAHPVRVTELPEAPDRGYDALPVDNLEAGSDPLVLRPGFPAVLEAHRALYGSGDTKSAIAQRRDQYPAW